MASAVSFLAPAKLNLSLQVFGKRPDGYHNIRSVMVPVSLYDEVTVEEAPAGISVECDAPGVPTDGGNSWDTTGLSWDFEQATAVQKIVINPRNTSTLFAATSEGVYRSTDAGETWSVSNSVLGPSQALGVSTGASINVKSRSSTN